MTNSALPSPTTIAGKLARSQLFERIDPGTLEKITAEFQWFSIPGGETLFRQGELDDSLYVVLSGRLGAFLPNDEGKEVLIRQMLTGETVGEMALLSGEPRSATVIALRDTELARISKHSFEALIDKHPGMLRFVTDLLVRRLREPPRTDGMIVSPRTVALFPLDPSVVNSGFTRSLASAIEDLGLKAIALDRSAAAQPIEWFNRLEDAHDLVLYQADFNASPFSRLCLHQADCLLLLADAERALERIPLAAEIADNPRRTPIELVALANDRSAREVQTNNLLKQFNPSMHHNVRPWMRRDVRRLARMITGRATGLVLSGGGARGFAHIGVIRALREARVELDLFGGTSMGAIVAAGAALEWDDRELCEHLRSAFSDDNPVNDYTVPVISLVRGRKASQAFRRHFGDKRIEDCVYPFFCLSTNLTASRVNVHRTGPVWLALRASTAIPGVLPPVVDGGQLLVDGGLMNNLPIDVMCDLKRGPVIAVDVSNDYGLGTTIDAIDQRPLWKLVGHARRGTPNIFTILMAAGTVSSCAQVRNLRDRVSLLIEPKLNGISMLNWKDFDRAVEAGYRSAVDALERNGAKPFLKGEVITLESSR